MLQNDVADPSDNIVTNLKALDMITVCFALNNVIWRRAKQAIC